MTDTVGGTATPELHHSRAENNTMAPIVMDSVMSWVSSPEVAIISSVAFLLLSITLLALCTNCNRGGSGYDVNGTMRNGRTNGSTKSGGEQDFEATTGWRSHTLPPNTLESSKTSADEPATVSTGQ